MRKRMIFFKEQKQNRARFGKSGFTLVELSVVLALTAILSTMTVTFSVFMNSFVAENRVEYDFLADCAALREDISCWVAENDVSGGKLLVNPDGTLDVRSDVLKSVRFENGALLLGAEEPINFDTIEGIFFDTDGELIKCTAYRTSNKGELIENDFVFSLRSADVEEVAENG